MRAEIEETRCCLCISPQCGIRFVTFFVFINFGLVALIFAFAQFFTELSDKGETMNAKTIYHKFDLEQEMADFVNKNPELCAKMGY